MTKDMKNLLAILLEKNRPNDFMVEREKNIYGTDLFGRQQLLYDETIDFFSKLETE